MATQRPISTISYNTEAFLREKLENLLKAHIIQSYQYICHKGEDGDKDHIHLRIEPNKRIDPMDIKEMFNEYEMGKEKPRGVRPWRPSKEEDWILYAVHDPEYLKLKYGGGDKGEKIPYQWQDIQAPFDYDVEVAFVRAKASLTHSSVNLASRLQNGNKPIDLILEGENPYIVNSLMHAVAGSDYSRLQAEYSALSNQMNALVVAIQDLGYSIECDDEGRVILHHINFPKSPSQQMEDLPDEEDLPF